MLQSNPWFTRTQWGWHNRAYRAGGYARNAYDWGKNYSRGVTPAMENGASAAIATLGTVANHSNPDASAGCPVGRTSKGHQEFMGFLQKDVDYKNNKRFTLASLLGS